LQEVRSQWEVMRDHEHTPLVNVQAWSEVLPGSPLFHSTVMFEHRPFETVFREMGTGCPHRRFRQIIQPNYPLNLAAYDTEELTLKLDFDDRRFEGVTIQRMLNHLRTLLESMAANPRQDLGELAVLTSTERNQLLVEWNRTAVEYPRNSCIHELFERQVDRTPEAVAVIFGDQHLTYRELNSRSDQLAHHLCELGVGPNVLVGICAGRSLEMVIGLLGILKAGGAYVPIDPTYPTERVAFILHDANAPIVLTQAKLLQTLPASMAAEVVNLDEWDCAQPDLNSHNMLRSATDANLAYLMYTSGSTGSPKGAMIPHRAIANHTRWMQSTFPMDEHDCVLQKTEFSFDVSVWEIFAPLLVGARLVMALPGGQKDPEYLINTVNEHQVTVLQVVPSQLRMLMEMPEFHTCHSLRHVFCGGEPMTYLSGSMRHPMPNCTTCTVRQRLPSIRFITRSRAVTATKSYRSVDRWRTRKPTSLTIIASPYPSAYPVSYISAGLKLVLATMASRSLRLKDFSPTPLAPSKARAFTGRVIWSAIYLMVISNF
jgi:non-ribosomal peptide synthetase component F